MDCRQHQGAHLREEDPAFLRLVETAEDSGQAGARGLRAGIRGQAEKAARKIAVQLRKQEAVFRVRTQGGFKRGMPGCKSGKQAGDVPGIAVPGVVPPRVFPKDCVRLREDRYIRRRAGPDLSARYFTATGAPAEALMELPTKQGVGGLAGIERRKRRGKARQRARARAVKRRAGREKGQYLALKEKIVLFKQAANLSIARLQAGIAAGLPPKPRPQAAL